MGTEDGWEKLSFECVRQWNRAVPSRWQTTINATKQVCARATIESSDRNTELAVRAAWDWLAIKLSSTPEKTRLKRFGSSGLACPDQSSRAPSDVHGARCKTAAATNGDTRGCRCLVCPARARLIAAGGCLVPSWRTSLFDRRFASRCSAVGSDSSSAVARDQCWTCSTPPLVRAL